MAAPLGYVLKVTRFTNDAAGLEKTLRLLQSLTVIIAANSVSPAAAAPWSLARKQFALGRRYLRFTKFIDCFVLAYSTFTASSSPFTTLLEVGKWSCLGMYLLLESCTILEAMGIWTTEWAPKLFIEAMKFWFYSLSFSLLLSLVGLWSLYTQTVATSTVQSSAKSEKEKPEVEEKEAIGYWQKKDQEEHAWNAKRRTITRKIVIDACDLFIPGVAVGWVTLRPDILGAVMVTSTVLASVDIWARVNPA